MDAKAKKRLEVIQKKLPALQKQLAGAKAQPDDPGEPARIQAEIIPAVAAMVISRNNDAPNAARSVARTAATVE